MISMSSPASIASGRAGNGAAVGQVGRIVEPVAGRRHCAVEERNGDDSAAEQLKLVSGNVRFQQRRISRHLHAFEDVGKVARLSSQWFLCCRSRG